ncbi:MAG TPA: nickel pincer cofactor biosynthesis protein LarC [Gemmatimonadales bacterium]|nr:nickel pincer cofactor biosynthesis protein LarC [Gemmatimonadales bacterium]
MPRRFAIIDPSAGVSGDMLLGALVGAGADPAWLTGLPARLGIDGVTVEIAEVDRAAIRATKVTVRLADGSHEGPGDIAPRHHVHAHGAADQAGEHVHGGHAPHRHVGELLAMVESAPLSGWVHARATACFRLLAEAEGRVHGVAPDDVALHEVGALDALVDIVGVVEGFEQLGISEIYHWPLALGDGWVRAAHGVMAVPTPATALLAEGMTVRNDGPARGEATTPTGAALLRALSNGPPPSAWRMRQSAFGAGERNPESYANVVRLIVAEPVQEAAEIVVLATDLDDLSPEYLEPLREAMVAAGALDVQVWATMGKKGRVSFRIEALAAPDAQAAVSDALLRHSTTGGLRLWRANRTTLERQIVTRTTEDGDQVRVKVFEAPDGLREKPELDDLQEVARRTGHPVPRVARELQDHRARRAGQTGSRESTTSTSQE